jgi:hypothetical protein
MTVIQEMKAAGLDIRQYKRSPGSAGEAVLAVSNDIIYFWPGDAEVDLVETDGDVRQALLRVTEDARVLTRTYQVWTYDGLRPRPEIVRGNFPVSLPTTAKYKVVTAERQPAQTSTYAYDRTACYWEFKVEATVPETSITFLLGYDEQHQFVCALPGHPSNMRAAHKSLRPSGLSRGTVRQGEWFFDPAVDGEMQESLSLALNRKIAKDWSNGFTPLNVNSNGHRGLNVHQDGQQYAIGAIVDTRGRHAPLVLARWHKVVRNLEQQVDERRRSRSWD